MLNTCTSQRRLLMTLEAAVVGTGRGRDVRCNGVLDFISKGRSSVRRSKWRGVQ